MAKRKTVIKLRRGTSAEWASSNEILSLGEPGFEKDTKKLKIGDGVTSWNSLPSIGASGLSEIGHTHTLSDITDYQEKAYVNYFDFDSNSVTNVVNSDTWYKLNTNTTSIFSNNGLVHSNNRITNVNERSLIVQMEGIASLSASNNTEIHISFFKNDTLIPCAEQIVTTSARGNVFFTSVIPFHCITELLENDYIEVWVKNKNTTDNITIANINVIVKEL
jgi:hypothetical protein